MPPRRATGVNSLNSPDTLSPVGPSAPPRSTSPSSGFTQFLTKPSKWFSRNASTSKIPQIPAEARPSMSGSGGRKHKISRPTDPRPLLDGYAGPSSKSVLDLSARTQASVEISRYHAPSTPSTPISPNAPGGLGDLRNISRKAWSRSADDLSKMPPANFSPIDTSFQDRVAEYRGRSGSHSSGIQPSSGNSSPSVPVARHPFPTLSTTPPSSSSPPRSATLPVAISVSAPILDEGHVPRTASPTQSHTRSHSFTPKLHSRLATPRYPPVPHRSGSTPTDREFDVRDLDKAGGQANRPGFGFGFGATPQAKSGSEGGPANGAQTSHRATTLLPPPTIVEPTQDQAEGEPDSKRASQIVYHSGFVNRLTEVPSNFQHAHLSLAKGWKPYKLELKGPKLYFYKPPSDRSAGIKELFPSGLVPPSEEDDQEFLLVEEDMLGRSKKSEAAGMAGRKKRAYWGRRRHPDLIMDAQTSGIVEKGTFEALVHEAVFATTSIHAESPSEAVSEAEKAACRMRWQEFAASVLVSVPLLVGRQVFEPEFLRCCDYFISGLDEEAKERERDRVAWLANEYLVGHGGPADRDAWVRWKEETIPGINLSAEASPSEIPASASNQAVFAVATTDSPNVNTFSPRPEESDARLSLLDALFPSVGSVVDAGDSHPLPTSSSRGPWTALDREGLSRDVLLRLDPSLIATSLTWFHRSILEQCPDNITAGFIASSDRRLSTDLEVVSNQTSPSSLFGSDNRPHWLTRFLLAQILAGDPPTTGYVVVNNSSTSTPAPPRRSDERGQTSRTHSRSEVISVWARIGELCRTSGDECSWKAIAAALCSRPIARLDKVWKRVEPQALVAVEGWAHIGPDGEMYETSQQRVTLWGGDVKDRMMRELRAAQGDGMNTVLQVKALGSARTLFEEFRTAFALCPRKTKVSDAEIGDGVKRLVAYWKDVAAQNGATTGIAAKCKRVDQFTSMSLAAEPKRKGLFEPYFWAQQGSLQAPYTSLLPLLFPEPLPNVTLLDRSRLIRGRVDSDASDTIQYQRHLDAQIRHEAGRQLHRLEGNEEVTKQLILGSGRTVISVYNGELLLGVQPGGFDSAANSRPPSKATSRPPSSIVEEKTMSRAPSIRVKPGSSAALDRKASMARRSSLPSVSHLSRQNFVTSEPSSDPPLRVVVQAGTLNNLVNILVHGLESVSVSVADDNGEMSLREGMMRELMVDRAEFSKVWWNVFRSFVSPFVFFELLRKIFLTGQLAGGVPAADPLQTIYLRNDVLMTMKEWLVTGGGAQDILDDSQLYTAVSSFLDPPLDKIVPDESTASQPALQQGMEMLQESRNLAKATFRSQTMRPTLSRGIQHQHRMQVGSRIGRGWVHSGTRELPDFDKMDPEAFVDNIDGMAYAAFSNVTQEDLFITADLLEVQTSDRTGWFPVRAPSIDEELVELQTMYTHVQETEPSSLISELGHDVIYRLLPPGVRSCIRAYLIIRKWIISRLIAPRLGPRARQARMELMLQVIEVARLRNAESPQNASVDKSCVRSFVEAVVSSALLSVESRLHARTWQNVAMNRGTSCDSLASLLSKPAIQTTQTKQSLTVDMGWLLERMLEIIATPDIVDAISEEVFSLVNFDKRRHLCNLINKSASLPTARKTIYSDEATRRGFERLNNIEKEVLRLQFDPRGIKDEAAREAASSGPNGVPASKKTVRPFQKLVAAQIEKNRRDKNLRTRLQREKQQEQTKNERRDDMLNRAMKKPVTHPPKVNRNKKSMSALFNFMRPISSAFGADTQPLAGHKRSASELDFVPSGKPAIVVSLMDAQVAQFINNERSYTFQLDTEDGGHYLLQAISKKEMNKWLESISKVTRNAAKRRLTYLGNSPKPQLADHIHHPVSAPSSKDPNAVFGVDLVQLLQREQESEYIPPGTVPIIIEQCLAEVEGRGLTEVGIYRIAGSAKEISGLKDAYNRGEYPLKETTDIHAVCDLIKSWFRVLPESVFPPSAYRDVMEAMRHENLEQRLQGIRRVIQSLPQPNFDLLRRVSEHLDKVTDYEEHNHMTAEALAIVFSPNLLRAPQNDFVMILNNMGLSHKLVKALITHFHTIFDEADPEAEVHSEDELESPIPEEDEEELEAEEEDDEGELEPSSPDAPEDHAEDSSDPQYQSDSR